MGSREHDSYTFTVGKLGTCSMFNIDAGIAILIGEHASLIEFPSVLLPRGLTHGSVVDIRVTRNEAQEQEKRESFIGLQDEILQMYGVNSPSPPVIRLRGVTQTTIAIEWDALDVAHADLHSLDVIRNGERIGKIPRARTSTSTKLSGLDMDTEYTIQLIMYTSAGSFVSNELHTKTHTLDDMSGVFVCIGNIPDAQLYEATTKVIETLGAHWSTEIQLETTHLVCAVQPDLNDAEQMKLYEKAELLTLPIVQPHWLFACENKKRYVVCTYSSMVNISPYYMDSMPPNALEVQEQVARMQEKPLPEAENEKTKDEAQHEDPATQEVMQESSVPDKDVLDAHEKSAPGLHEEGNVWDVPPAVSNETEQWAVSNVEKSQEHNITEESEESREPEGVKEDTEEVHTEEVKDAEELEKPMEKAGEPEPQVVHAETEEPEVSKTETEQLEELTEVKEKAEETKGEAPAESSSLLGPEFDNPPSKEHDMSALSDSQRMEADMENIDLNDA